MTQGPPASGRGPRGCESQCGAPRHPAPGRWTQRLARVALAAMIVGIDGPAGAGKSTVARAVAQRLGFGYLDTGAMYRALALEVLERGGPAVQRSAELDLSFDDGISLAGRDVTEAIRAPEVSEAASKLASDSDVRRALVQKQRDILSSGDWVAEGRDIGTVVAPDAELKVFLTASPQERAKRRARQLGTDWQLVLQDQALRDAQDSQRLDSPLRAAEDAVTVDSTDVDVCNVVAEIISLVRQAADN